MAKKQKIDKQLSKAADLILDLLAELPREHAEAARAEISELAAKSSRSAARGRVSKPRRSVGSRPSRRSAAKSA
jgi:hypothetical protein